MGKKVLIATIEFESSEADKPGKIGTLVNKAVENYLDRMSYEFFHKCSTPMEELEEGGIHITVVHGVRRDASNLPLPEPEYKMPLPGGRVRVIKGRLTTRVLQSLLVDKDPSEYRQEQTEERKV